MTGNLAPIAIFAYRRRRHLAAVLDALERCPEFSASSVFVFSDGPKNAAASADVQEVRQMLAARRRPNMTIVEAPANQGLANSIIAGVNGLCEQHGKVIVIEDDLVVSSTLLAWFNAALDRYADEPSVWQVSGFQFPIASFARRGDSMFLNISSSWGWATWKRAWKKFDRTAAGWEALRSDAGLARCFDLNGSYPYSAMLTSQMAGGVDSWAVRLWWSVFQNRGLTLYPAQSLVSNIGEDETATHSTSRVRRWISRRASRPPAEIFPSFPDAIRLDAAAQVALERFLRRGSSITAMLKKLSAPLRWVGP